MRTIPAIVKDLNIWLNYEDVVQISQKNLEWIGGILFIEIEKGIVTHQQNLEDAKAKIHEYQQELRLARQCLKSTTSQQASYPTQRGADSET